MPIRLVYDTRKLQNYIIMQGNWALRGQNHVLCYFSRNMGLKWPILHQSWVQIGFVDLENNLDDMHVNMTCLWHQKVAKVRCNARKLSFEGSNHILCYFTYMGLWWPIRHQSRVQISYVGLKNNLDNFHVNKTWFLHQEVPYFQKTSIILSTPLKLIIPCIMTQICNFKM